MKTKDITLIGLLMAIAVIIRMVIPGFFFGMKPDMLLLMMFIGIALFRSPSHTLVMALGFGLIAAATTTFPAGQIPNIIDKLVTASAFLAMTAFVGEITTLKMGAMTAVGTLISGFIFLSAAVLMFGLPAPFTALFMAVVVPTAVVNTIVATLVYPVVLKVRNM